MYSKKSEYEMQALLHVPTILPFIKLKGLYRLRKTWQLSFTNSPMPMDVHDTVVLVVSGTAAQPQDLKIDGLLLE